MFSYLLIVSVSKDQKVSKQVNGEGNIKQPEVIKPLKKKKNNKINNK